MEDMLFTIIRAANDLTPRLARLALPGRTAIETPHYLANTSRGVVPHLTQDTLKRSTSISGLYTSLEDFIERAPPPVCKYGSLRQFLAVPESQILVLGARRTPPVVPPPATSNTDTSVAVSTSVGFRFLESDDYARQVDGLGADIVVGLADVPSGRALVAKRIEKATDRSIDWVALHLAERERKEVHGQYFASLLPVTCANQLYYAENLIEEHLKQIHGLAIYGLDTLTDLPAQFEALPRIGFTEAATPLQALHHLQRGLDLLILPFLDKATDAGLALTFAFGQSEALPEQALPLGMDMWVTQHAIDLSPLVEGCLCYTCGKHHRAYVQHLLSAKEMLGWVLLQVHNHHVVSLFFAGVRASIANDIFAADMDAFARRYEPELPIKTGQGPRIRGYQRRTERAAESKQNPKGFKKLTEPRLPKSTLAKTTGLPDDFDLALLEEPDDFSQ